MHRFSAFPSLKLSEKTQSESTENSSSFIIATKMLCENGFCTEEERNAQMQVKNDNEEKFAHKHD